MLRPGLGPRCTTVRFSRRQTLALRPTGRASSPARYQRIRCCPTVLTTAPPWAPAPAADKMAHGRAVGWGHPEVGRGTADPGARQLPDRLDDSSIDLEGSEFKIIDIGQGDTADSTIVYVPSIAAVVGGDVVYNQVHMMTAETDEKSRENWIANLDEIAALEPQIVVSGHHRVGAPLAPESIGASQQYLRDFSRIVNEKETVEDIVAAMLDLHGDRDNPRVVWHCAREAVKKRQKGWP